MVVIFLFLGSFRTVLVPVAVIPLSLIGAVFLIQALGFTLNLLTLLAIALSRVRVHAGRSRFHLGHRGLDSFADDVVEARSNERAWPTRRRRQSHVRAHQGEVRASARPD